MAARPRVKDWVKCLNTGRVGVVTGSYTIGADKGVVQVNVRWDGEPHTENYRYEVYQIQLLTRWWHV